MCFVPFSFKYFAIISLATCLSSSTDQDANPLNVDELSCFLGDMYNISHPGKQIKGNIKAIKVHQNFTNVDSWSGVSILLAFCEIACLFFPHYLQNINT